MRQEYTRFKSMKYKQGIVVRVISSKGEINKRSFKIFNFKFDVFTLIPI